MEPLITDRRLTVAIFGVRSFAAECYLGVFEELGIDVVAIDPQHPLPWPEADRVPTYTTINKLVADGRPIDLFVMADWTVPPVPVLTRAVNAGWPVLCDEFVASTKALEALLVAAQTRGQHVFAGLPGDFDGVVDQEASGPGELGHVTAAETTWERPFADGSRYAKTLLGVATRELLPSMLAYALTGAAAAAVPRRVRLAPLRIWDGMIVFLELAGGVSMTFTIVYDGDDCIQDLGTMTVTGAVTRVLALGESLGQRYTDQLLRALRVLRNDPGALVELNPSDPVRTTVRAVMVAVDTALAASDRRWVDVRVA